MELVLRVVMVVLGFLTVLRDHQPFMDPVEDQGLRGVLLALVVRMLATGRQTTRLLVLVLRTLAAVAAAVGMRLVLARRVALVVLVS